MSDCFVLYLLLICMKKKKSGAGKFTNNNIGRKTILCRTSFYRIDTRNIYDRWKGSNRIYIELPFER